MPSYIIKPDREVDFYVRWSTIVDSPTAWGTLSELQDDLGPTELSHEKLTRVNTFGSSSKLGVYGWEDDDLFLVREIGPTPFFVSKENLKAFCESLDPIDHDTYDPSLTTPYKEEQGPVA